jgi:hypothetical protein
VSPLLEAYLEAFHQKVTEWDPHINHQATRAAGSAASLAQANQQLADATFEHAMRLLEEGELSTVSFASHICVGLTQSLQEKLKLARKEAKIQRALSVFFGGGVEQVPEVPDIDEASLPPIIPLAPCMAKPIHIW